MEDAAMGNTDHCRSCTQEMSCRRLRARARLPASLPWTTVLQSMYHKRLNLLPTNNNWPREILGPSESPRGTATLVFSHQTEV